jgi:hypothetical protein
MKSRAPIISVCLAAGLLMSACGAPSSTNTPPAPSASPSSASTALPQLSTAIAATATALARPPLPATAASLPSATAEPPTATTAAATTGPQPTSVPATAAPVQPQAAEAILILTPGGSSSVTSPVRVAGEADPTFEQNLVVQITDANGAVIATQPTTIQAAAPARGPFDVQVPFTVTAPGPGRISVFSTSARDGGLIHLASVEVSLLSAGTAAIVPGPEHPETHLILEPAPQAQMSGGTLHLSGYSAYVFESQLSLAVCGEGGSGAPEPVCGTADNVLATGTAAIAAPDVGQPGPFASLLAYHVSTTVAGRLAVYSRSPRDGGIVHLSSVPVSLAP